MIEALIDIAIVAAIAVAVIRYRAWDAVNQPGEEE
jgi:hypothetical protein